MGDYDSFVAKFYTATGIDLTQYRQSQMERRLTTLRDRRGYTNFTHYLEAALHDADLMAELMDRLTINVSSFYRNPERWQSFGALIAKNREQNGVLRAWSAACSTGQEPYTMAMVFSEFMTLSQMEILATDIDPHALRVGQLGIYHSDDLLTIPAPMRGRFIHTLDPSQGRFSDDVRARISFKLHNLLSDDFPNNLDVVVCRNVFIYFTDDAKEKLYYKFSESLRPGGILFVGSTEQIFHSETYGLTQIAPFFYTKIG